MSITTGLSDLQKIDANNFELFTPSVESVSLQVNFNKGTSTDMTIKAYTAPYYADGQKVAISETDATTNITTQWFRKITATTPDAARTAARSTW